MRRLVARYQTVYSRVWESDGFKIEYYVGYKQEQRTFIPIVITVEKGPADDECSFRFFGPRWEVEPVEREIDMAKHPENWGSCYFCGASYYYYQSKILEGRRVVCQNCGKEFKLDAD
ncbi:MAG: hypothetical protein ACFFEU_08535 [Candidatus Thorarchaeota archaeon]